MDVKAILRRAEEIRKNLLNDEKLAFYLDKERGNIPESKIGNGEIKLFIIGQDPTVKNENSRDKIKVVLNLDKPNSLKKYINCIVEQLGLDFDKNVYATNLLKCFFMEPPASIKGVKVINEYAPYWIGLLKEELAKYPKAKVITLGQPMLNAIIINGSKNVRDYWGYQGKNQADVTKFKYCDANDNLLQRKFYPFPHQPSIRKEFYKNHLDRYVDWVKSN